MSRTTSPRIPALGRCAALATILAVATADGAAAAERDCYRPDVPRLDNFEDRHAFVAALDDYYGQASFYIGCLDRQAADIAASYEAQIAEMRAEIEFQRQTELAAYAAEREAVMQEITGVVNGPATAAAR